MTSTLGPPAASRFPPVGYLDDWNVAAGQEVAVHVSCESPSFLARVVRLSYQMTQDGALELTEEPIPTELDGVDFPGGLQPILPGSWMETDDDLTFGRGVSVHMWFKPSLRDGRAALGSLVGNDATYLLSLDGEGRPSAMVEIAGESIEIHLPDPVDLDVWHRVALDHCWESGRLRLEAWYEKEGFGTATQSGASVEGDTALVDGPLRLRVRFGTHTHGDERIYHFDGKLDSPSVHDAPRDPISDESEPLGERSVLASWDPGQEVDSDIVVDVSGHNHHARLYNRPTRAVTGRSWDGSVQHFLEDPCQYRAVHFHRDDLGDVGWDVSARFRLADDIPSAVYAVRVEAEGQLSHIPFFVRGGPDDEAKPLAVVLPTFTYLAYANEHVFSRPAVHQWVSEVHNIASVDYPIDRFDEYVAATSMHSLYDLHADGSGVCLSSRRRPIVTMRPDAQMAHVSDGQGAPHGFAEDLYLLAWLDREQIDYEVLTDEHIHADGAEALHEYRAVIFASHPEYVSQQILDACATYLDQGGRMIYLGGNGFYWAVSLDSHTGDTIELRRWAGTQGWVAAAGERHHAMTGEPGGTWRSRGRAPQRLVGVGFCAQGFDVNSAYRRRAASYDPSVAWVFNGVEGESFGDEENLVNHRGAAGFEIDKADTDLGTPPETLVLASATRFSSAYSAADEDKREAGLEPSARGSNLEIRSDLVLLPTANGGAVFSVGSIAWCGALWARGGDGDTARITRNVIEAFCRDTLPDRFGAKS